MKNSQTMMAAQTFRAMIPEVPSRVIRSRVRQGKLEKSTLTGPQADLSSVAVKEFAAKVFEVGEPSDAESEVSRCPEAEAEIAGIKQTEAAAENALDLASPKKKLRWYGDSCYASS